MTHRNTEVRIGLGRYEDLLLWLIGAWFFTVHTLSIKLHVQRRKTFGNQLCRRALKPLSELAGLSAVPNVSCFSLVLPAPSPSLSFFWWLRDFTFSGEMC